MGLIYKDMKQNCSSTEASCTNSCYEGEVMFPCHLPPRTQWRTFPIPVQACNNKYLEALTLFHVINVNVLHFPFLFSQHRGGLFNPVTQQHL